MKRVSRALLKWAATLFAAIAGYSLGQILCAALQGAISFFNFVPYVTNVLWLSGAVTTYLSATLATDFAVRCAPAWHQKVRWLVLLPIFVIQLLQVCSIPAVGGTRQNTFAAYAIEGLVVISWLMFKAWKRPL